MIIINLPEIVAQIGRQHRNYDDPLNSSVRSLKMKLKADEEAYIIFMVFDLGRMTISFESPYPYSEQSLKRYRYFGNNSAASFQCFLVRESESLGYLLSSVWNDILLVLQQEGMVNCDLAHLVRSLVTSELVMIGDKKGQGQINFSKLLMSEPYDMQTSMMLLEKKGLRYGDEEIKFEQLLRASQGITNKRQRFVLVVPQIREANGNIVTLSTHADYRDLVIKINKLKDNDSDLVSEEMQRTCYVCHAHKARVESGYSKKFRRDGPNKIFTTTTINSARGIVGTGYDDSYSICSSCYEDLLAGEAVVDQYYKMQIAGEKTFVLIEALLDQFDYSILAKLKSDVDLAFHSKSAAEWLKSVEAESLWFEQNFYSLNFLIYRSDGNSISILETIEDIPTLRFFRVMMMLQKFSQQLSGHIKNLTIGSIYRIVPVREMTRGGKKTQADVGRVLTLYKVLLSGGMIKDNTLYGYAVEALDKGLRQLDKDQPDNYSNLLLYNFKGKEDFFIKHIVMSYLVLVHMVQDMGVLEGKIFNSSSEEVKIVPADAGITEKTIAQMESFLGEQGYIRQARALFYLGVLMQRVAAAQVAKEHKTKPILKKISFQGMTYRDVQILYENVIEKLRQYEKFTYFTERVMNKFHEYFGTLDDKSPLNEHANVFYIMSGYAYLVGTKPVGSDENGEPDEELEQETKSV